MPTANLTMPSLRHHQWSSDDCNAGDDDCFFESLDRVPSSISIDFDVAASSASDSDDDQDDVRVSFASAVGPPSCFRNHNTSQVIREEPEDAGDAGGGYDYGIWMAEPVSIQERRRLLLHGMGLTSGKNLWRDPSRRCLSRTRTRILPSVIQEQQEQPNSQPQQHEDSAAQEATPSPPAFLPRSRSANSIAQASPTPYSSLLRCNSEPPSLSERLGDNPSGGSGNSSCSAADGEDARSKLATASCRIKNLDTGKEFEVSQLGKDGSWGRLSDVKTGNQLTMEEFEKDLGYSDVVKDVMRRDDLTSDDKNGSMKQRSTSSSKSRSGSSKKKGGWLKNIMVVASSVTGLGLNSDKDKDKEKGDSACKPPTSSSSSSSSSSELMKVRQHGKPYKELTGLYMCQEIQAHQGSIWTIKFSIDGRYMASAGEDRVVHVWQALERDTSGNSSSSLSDSITRDEPQEASIGAANVSPDRPSVLSSQGSKKRMLRKGLVPFGSSRKSLPDNISVPDTIFYLSEKPFCSFHGHLDDVLDLSWSKSQHLLSSSMDKTVRLWDMDTKTCLKMFAHNDYVTSVQFNPVDDEFFISGSLDAKVRIWSVTDRQVVDWCDLHEMVTAACYTPDGQGALVGSHKGSCRFYNTSDGTLCQQGQIDIQSKKKKSQAKKVTGFQFAPGSSSDVLVTSADSQLRVFNGFDMIHKFRGFRNTSSQIAASFTSDGKYVVCASEDSHVYVWKRETSSSGRSGGKGWTTTRSHEHFPCRHVSVAIPWPRSSSNNRRPSGSTSHRLDEGSQSSRNLCPPPVPKKTLVEQNSSLTSSDDLHHSSRWGSGIGSSSVSVSSSSSSSSSYWGWYGGGGSKNSSSSNDEANAWGLAIVTAGFGGDIKIYQNFGLPVRLARQANLF